MSRIRVLIADDSLFMRQMVASMLSADPQIEIVGTASNGQEALARAEELRPDVITLDVEMPVLDGLAALERLMAGNPTPVIMLSAITTEGAEATLRALELGAVDFITKPAGGPLPVLDGVARTLVEKVKIAARARPRSRRPARRTLPRLVFIASSTGGPSALADVLSRLPASLAVPVVVVQHMPTGFTASLAERLDRLAPLAVREAGCGIAPRPGTVYLAPGGRHLLLRNGGFVLDDSPPVGGLRPCADVTLLSLIEGFAPILGVVLTGMGQDGLAGFRRVKETGGVVIAQNEETCVVYGMPRAVVEAGLADVVLPLERIGHEIEHMVRG